MNRITWSSIAASLVLCSGAMLLVPTSWSPPVAAQEEEVEEERNEEQRDEEVGPEELEQRLNEIEELIERAEQRGDEDRIRELRREGERLIDRLEEFERAREDDEEERSQEEEELERHLREIEIHRLELEVERLHQEMNAARQEASVRLAEIAENEETSASYAISQAIDQLGEEAAIDFLAELQKETENEAILRIILHHLATLNHHADRPDAARRALRALILGK